MQPSTPSCLHPPPTRLTLLPMRQLLQLSPPLLDLLQLWSLSLLLSTPSCLHPPPARLSQLPISQPLQPSLLSSSPSPPFRLSCLLLPSLSLFSSQLGCCSGHLLPPRQPCQLCCLSLPCPRQPLHPRQTCATTNFWQQKAVLAKAASMYKLVSSGCWGTFCCFKAGHRGKAGHVWQEEA